MDGKKIIICLICMFCLIGCGSTDTKSHLEVPAKIIIESDERCEELMQGQDSFEIWYEACRQTWKQNLDQGQVLFLELLYMEEDMVMQSPVEITFVYEEGILWSKEGRPLELNGFVYSFFPLGGECVAITEDGNYLDEAFVLPFVPASKLSKMVTNWLEE